MFETWSSPWCKSQTPMAHRSVERSRSKSLLRPALFHRGRPIRSSRTTPGRVPRLLRLHARLTRLRVLDSLLLQVRDRRCFRHLAHRSRLRVLGSLMSFRVVRYFQHLVLGLAGRLRAIRCLRGGCHVMQVILFRLVLESLWLQLLHRSSEARRFLLLLALPRTLLSSLAPRALDIACRLHLWVISVMDLRRPQCLPGCPKRSSTWLLAMLWLSISAKLSTTLPFNVNSWVSPATWWCQAPRLRRRSDLLARLLPRQSPFARRDRGVSTVVPANAPLVFGNRSSLLAALVRCRAALFGRCAAASAAGLSLLLEWMPVIGHAAIA